MGIAEQRRRKEKNGNVETCYAKEMRRVVQGCIGIAEKSAEKATTRPETSCKGIELSGLAEKRNSAVLRRGAKHRYDVSGVETEWRRCALKRKGKVEKMFETKRHRGDWTRVAAE